MGKENIIIKKKIKGEADIFNEILSGKKYEEEDIYEDEKEEIGGAKESQIEEEASSKEPVSAKSDSTKTFPAKASMPEGNFAQAFGKSLSQGFSQKAFVPKAPFSQGFSQKAFAKVKELVKAPVKPRKSREVKEDSSEEIIEEELPVVENEEKEDAESGKEDEEPEEEEEKDVEEEDVSIDKENGIIEEGIREKAGDDFEDGGEEDEEGKEDKKKKAEKSGIKDKIRDTILRKAGDAASGDDSFGASIKLGFLNDPEKKNNFIGRKKSVFKKYGYEAALFVGRVHETEHKAENIYLDSMNPHVVFVCGSRGSGKSYVLGVVAEELALNNPNVGVIAIDPIGVFWSMRFPNKEKGEVDKLAEWGLKPRGLENIKVFVPHGMVGRIPKSTYDSGFAIQPSLLTAEDWCLTFRMERFSPTGLLLDKSLKKVEVGFTDKETKKKVAGSEKAYSIEDIIQCLENDEELNSRERGYKQDSIRALVSRFEAAKNWGIFSKEGTPLGELSREGQLSILDTSFLEDTVTALVIGVLARRVLAARKISTRKEAATKFKTLDVEKLLELEIPPTWLIIDEAHTLVPSGNEKTPASAALTEYVKQGRRPGCSLAIATQQPSAIDTKVLSQLDIMIAHKLVFDDDIKAINKRMPTIVPAAYKKSSFIKTLPIGVALVGDREEETTRSFIMNIRPRMSQHEGRDTDTASLTKNLSKEEVENLCHASIMSELGKNPSMKRSKLESVVDSLNAKYKVRLDLARIVSRLGENGVVMANDVLSIGAIAGAVQEQIVLAEEEEKDENLPEGEIGVIEDEETQGVKVPAGQKQAGEKKAIVAVESTELLAIPSRISEKEIAGIVERIRKKKLFGFVGDEEKVSSVSMKYVTLWKLTYDSFAAKSEFVRKTSFIDSVTGEFIHWKEGRFVESRGMADVSSLGDDEATVLRELMKKEMMVAEIMANTSLPEGKVLRIMNKLVEIGVARFAVDKKNDAKMYWLSEKIQLPPNERAKLLQSIDNLPRERMEALPKEKELFSKENAVVGIKKIWPKIIIQKAEEVYRPVWEGVLQGKEGERKIVIDAVNGERIR